MDQTLDQVVKSRNIRFNGKVAGAGVQKRQFNQNRGGKTFFQNRRQGFNQMRPRGNVVRNFGGMGGMRRPQFRRPGFVQNNTFQRRNNFGMMNRRPMNMNFQNRQNFGGFMQRRNQGFVQQRTPMRFNNTFQGSQMRFRPQQQMQQNRPFNNQQMGQQQSTKLYISNLDFGVSNQDIKELFSEFGPMVRYGVNHSTAGRSVGTAEVIFKNKISAVKAYQKYNQVTLDGRPMKLEVSGGPMMQNRPQQVGFRPRMQQQQQMRQSPQKRLVNNRPRPVMMNKTFNNKPGFVKTRQNLAAAMVKRARNTMMMRNKMGGMKGKMGGMKGGKNQVPDVNQLDADLEAYANSKD
ncbi:uncharacterized protein LOC142343104 [Convolutriloba macropyga]|uniref:uncharacterized protein LOC142343104 n=1 Tax=Convolutriloba macropyga TaxID=536237 RepID=UPI003F526D36